MKLFVLNANRLSGAILLNPKTFKVYTSNICNLKARSKILAILRLFILVIVLDLLSQIILISNNLTVEIITVIITLIVSYIFSKTEITEAEFTEKIDENHLTPINYQDNIFMLENIINNNITIIKKTLIS